MGRVVAVACFLLSLVSSLALRNVYLCVLDQVLAIQLGLLRVLRLRIHQGLKFVREGMGFLLSSRNLWSQGLASIDRTNASDTVSASSLADRRTQRSPLVSSNPTDATDTISASSSGDRRIQGCRPILLGPWRLAQP